MTRTASRLSLLLPFVFITGMCSSPSSSGPPGQQQSLRIGLYTFFGERLTADSVSAAPEGLFEFARFAGYNTVEFCDWSFEYPRAELPEYFQRSRDVMQRARRSGLEVFVLLLTNMSRERAIRNFKEPDPSRKGSLLFNPVSEPREYEQRLADIELAIQEAYSSADGFEVFAGDWGGCLEEGCDISQFLRFARDYRDILNRLGLADREMSLNLWAIANWGRSMDPGQPAFWDSEIELSERVISSDISFADAVTFAGHHLYRYYTFQVYAKAGLPVPVWPHMRDVEQARKGVKAVYLWPHFLVDDDRFRKQTWRKAHFEFRYIKKLAKDIRGLGLDGAFANSYAPGPQMANIFAFARLLQNPERTVESVYREFALLLVSPQFVPDLVQVFAFLENRSWWASQLPKSFRLPAIPCALLSLAEAETALSRVVPLKQSPAPLLLSPLEYLEELKKSLTAFQRSAGKQGSTGAVTPR